MKKGAKITPIFNRGSNRFTKSFERYDNPVSVAIDLKLNLKQVSVSNDGLLDSISQ